MGISDALQKAREEFKNAKWKTTSDYEKEGGPKIPGPKKAIRVQKTTVTAAPVESYPEDDAPPTDSKGNYLPPPSGMKKGGKVAAKCACGGGKMKKMASGGKVSSASKRADGIAVRGKTRGMMR